MAREKSMTGLRWPRKNARGQATVEFALSIVLVMVFILGIIELLMLIYAYNVLADSAKEGLRFAIVHGTGNTNCNGPGPAPTGVTCDATAAGVVTAVTTYAQFSFHDTSKMAVTADYNPGGNNGTNACSTPSCLVRVTVSYPYQPFFGLGWPSVTVNAAAEGRIVN